MLSSQLKKKYPYFTNTKNSNKLSEEWEKHVAHVGSYDKATEWLLYDSKKK